MITLRKLVLPSFLAVMLLSTSACTSETTAGGFPPTSARSNPDQSANPSAAAPPRADSAGPSTAPPRAAAQQLSPASPVDARTVLAEFRSRGMVGHLEALQRIADDNGGNRAAG
ncbi:hypothetical protein ACFVVK_11345, partial [Arthrobacter sp. NPDC058192]